MKTYRHKVSVHWGDTDPARIVFYPNYYIWFDQSTRLLFDSVGLDWDHLQAKYGVPGCPLVETHARYIGYGGMLAESFVAVMALMFQSIFTFAKLPMDWIQGALDWCGGQVAAGISGLGEFAENIKGQLVVWAGIVSICTAILIHLIIQKFF